MPTISPTPHTQRARLSIVFGELGNIAGSPHRAATQAAWAFAAVTPQERLYLACQVVHLDTLAWQMEAAHV